MSRQPAFEDLKAEYELLWSTMDFDPGQKPAVEREARRVMAGKRRYEIIAAKVGPKFPWAFAGIAHLMECSLNFSQHLHNGDPLTDRTKQVPPHRPATGTPPFTFEESAVDALKLKELHRITSWTLARFSYEIERYNGFGYRLYHPKEKTPYLWARTNHNDGTGKYVADGKWSDSAPSEGQCGAMAVLKCLMEMDPSIRFDDEDAEPYVGPDEEVVRAVQKRLNELGYRCGAEDGRLTTGGLTAGAIMAFKEAHGLQPINSEITDEFRAALIGAPAREPSDARKNATADDLPDSSIIKQAQDAAKNASYLKRFLEMIGLGGLIGGGTISASDVSNAQGTLAAIMKVIGPMLPWIIGGAVVLAIIWFALHHIQALSARIVERRVEDHRTGKTL